MTDRMTNERIAELATTQQWTPDQKFSLLRIGDLVEIRTDGTITYGPDYSPDDAAKMLWNAIASMGLAVSTERAALAAMDTPKGGGMSKVINASEWKDRKRLAEARRLQHIIGRDEFTDAEIVGGSFCDGLMNGVSTVAMHEAYMQSSGAMDFEARVWAEIEKVRK